MEFAVISNIKTIVQKQILKLLTQIHKQEIYRL